MILIFFNPLTSKHTVFFPTQGSLIYQTYFVLHKILIKWETEEHKLISHLILQRVNLPSGTQKIKRYTNPECKQTCTDASCSEFLMVKHENMVEFFSPPANHISVLSWSSFWYVCKVTNEFLDFYYMTQ